MSLIIYSVVEAIGKAIDNSLEKGALFSVIESGSEMVMDIKSRFNPISDEEEVLLNSFKGKYGAVESLKSIQALLLQHNAQVHLINDQYKADYKWKMFNAHPRFYIEGEIEKTFIEKYNYRIELPDYTLVLDYYFNPLSVKEI